MADRGAFLSFLDELARPGQIVRNLLAGRGTSAWHQTEQLGANALDAFLPGDWISDDIAKPEDYISGRELVGAPDDLFGHAAGFATELATDPLSFIPASWAGKAVGGLGKVAEAGVNAADKILPGTAEGVADAGRAIRNIAGQQRADHPELWNAIDRASGRSAVVGQAGNAATRKALGALDERQRSIIGDALSAPGGVKFGPDGIPTGPLVNSGIDPSTGLSFDSIRNRIAAHPDVKPEEVDALADAANQAVDIGRNQKARPGGFDPISQANLPDEYLSRSYNGLKQDPLAALMGDSGPGLANALKARKNVDWRDIKATLEANPGSSFERDALVRLATRAGQQADMAKKADIGSSIYDLLRQGKMQLPKKMLEDEATRLRGAVAKPPIPESGAYEDVGKMLGGDAADPALVDPYGTALGAGKGKVSEQADVASLLGGAPVAREAPDGINAVNDAVQADQAGKAVVGTSARQPSLTLADFKPEEIDAATKSILGKDFALSDPDAKAVVRGALGELSKDSPETAKLALDTFNGLAPRGAVMKALATGNQWFKRFMTFGVGIPRAGAIVRNRINTIQQTFSNPATRAQTLEMAKSLPADMSGAVADALGIKALKTESSGTIEAYEHALANSGGDDAKAIADFGKTHPEEAALIGNGAIDGWVRSDDLINEVARSPLRQKLQSFLDMPSKIARGIEDRTRLQLGKLQMQKYMADGMSMDAAAKAAVGDVATSLYRYGITSAAHRTLRDVAPYAQWTVQAVPAEAKFLAGNPQALSAVANAMSRDPNAPPLPPYLEDKNTIDLGADSTGNRQVISGMAWPWETLSEIPNPSASVGDFGRELEQNVVGQLAPPLKTAYAVAAGHEPAFSTPFGAYSKIPIVGDAGEAGRLYNEVASTGITAPIDAPARIIDRLLDDRRSVPVRLLNSLTGASIDTVDPARARIQQLQNDLQRNPDVSSAAHLTSQDPETAAVIQALQEVQRRMKAKKKAP